jgi:murein L,D-transpeptidase YcbB/YkuD
MRFTPLLVAACLWMAAAAATPDPGTAAPPEALRARLATLAAGDRVTIAGDELVSHRVVPRVYEATGMRLLWQDSARFDALLAAIREAADDGLRPEDYHLGALERLATDATRGADADLLATDAYVMLLYDLYLGKVDPLSIEPNWKLPGRPLREQQALDFVVAALASGRIGEAAARVRPHHWLYEHGRAALARYRAIARAGGWGTVGRGPKLEPGARDVRVPELRRRLAASGDYTGPVGDSPEYDVALVAAVRVFQRRHLLTDDGEVGASTLRELNVPAESRIDQLRINLERGRWVLYEIGDEDLVVVDIAGYGVRYLRNRAVIWRGRAIVGRPYRQTPVFRAEIEDVVFNPTWTVPPGILARDVLPQMQAGEDVLTHKRLKVFDRAGAPVDPAGVRWSDYTAANFPYVLRQDAGDDNSLGRVKIDFPNPYLVYLHDTPARALFERSQRTFSSGCIRVERPLELAELLLADPVRWDAAAIRAAVDAGTTRTVRLARKVPVLLIYWTADEDADGRVVFKRDVYGRDARLLRALDGRFRFGTRIKA